MDLEVRVPQVEGNIELIWLFIIPQPWHYITSLKERLIDLWLVNAHVDVEKVNNELSLIFVSS